MRALRYFEIEATQVADLFRRASNKIQRWVLEHRVHYVVIAGEMDLRGTKDNTTDPRAASDRITPPRGARRAVFDNGLISFTNGSAVTVNVAVPQGKKRRLVAMSGVNGDSVARSPSFLLQIANTAPGATPTWVTHHSFLAGDSSISSAFEADWPDTAATTNSMRPTPLFGFFRGGDGNRVRVQFSWPSGGAGAAGSTGRHAVSWEEEPDDGDNSIDDRTTIGGTA